MMTQNSLVVLVGAVALVFASLSAHSDEAPADLAKLNLQFSAAVERISQPILGRLKADLETYKTRSTKSGNLEAAIAADRQLQQLKKSSDLSMMLSDSNDPSSLTDLINGHLVAEKNAIAPLERKYIIALQSLKQSYMSDGKLDESLAVEKTLERVQKEEATDASLKNAFPTKLFGVRYAFISAGRWLEFQEDGTVKSWDGVKTWKITGKNELTLGVGSKIVEKPDGTIIAFNYKGQQVLFHPIHRD